MKWFRVWTDIIDDYKVAQLTDYEFRLFIFLLACASEEDAINGRLTRDLPAINRRCRRRNDHFNRAVETFQRVGLVSVSVDGYITVNNWNKRQFLSDKAYSRVKKYRQQRQQRAGRNVSVTVNETPSDSDTDTDTEKKTPISPKRGSEYSSRFVTFWEIYPLKIGKRAASTAWLKLDKAELLPADEKITDAVKKQIAWRETANGSFRPEWKHPATWLNGCCWDDVVDETPQGSVDEFTAARLDYEKQKREGTWTPIT